MKLKLVIALSLVPLLAGCFTFEFPNLVSDSVKAGKDVVETVTGKNTDSAGKGVMFSNTVVAEANSPSEALEGRCLKELEDLAKARLGKNQIAYRVVSKEVTKKDDRLVATCRLEII